MNLWLLELRNTEEIIRHVYISKCENLGLENDEGEGTLIIYLKYSGLEQDNDANAIEGTRVTLPSRPLKTNTAVYNTARRLSIRVPKGDDNSKSRGRLEVIVELWERNKGYHCTSIGRISDEHLLNLHHTELKEDKKKDGGKSTAVEEGGGKDAKAIASKEHSDQGNGGCAEGDAGDAPKQEPSPRRDQIACVAVDLERITSMISITAPSNESPTTGGGSGKSSILFPSFFSPTAASSPPPRSEGSAPPENNTAKNAGETSKEGERAKNGGMINNAASSASKLFSSLFNSSPAGRGNSDAPESGVEKHGASGQGQSASSKAAEAAAAAAGKEEGDSKKASPPPSPSKAPPVPSSREGEEGGGGGGGAGQPGNEASNDTAAGGCVKEDGKEEKDNNPLPPPVRVFIGALPKVPSSRKRVFFIRHGESRWNKASANKDIVGLVKEVDHSLSEEGKHQCMDLQIKILKMSNEEDRQGAKADDAKGGRDNKEYQEKLEKEFFSVRRVYCSPLTRAVQTAVICLADHPLFSDDEEGKIRKKKEGGGESPEEEGYITLLDSARERRNFGSFDTQGKAVGDEIRVRAEDEFQELFSDQGVPKFVRRMLTRIDPNMCTFAWWNCFKESSGSFKARVEEFCNHIAFDEEETIIVVGHSHFIRDFIKVHMSEKYKKLHPEESKDFGLFTVENCGVVGLDIDFTTPSSPIIHDVQLMFGSKLKVKQHIIQDSKNILGGMISSVQRFVDKQVKARDKRKSQRFREREGEWWFHLYREMNREAAVESYKTTDTRTGVSSWARWLLNKHLGSIYFGMLSKAKPSAEKEGYYHGDNTQVTDMEDATQDEMDAVLTPWDIDTLYEDLLEMKLIKAVRRPSSVRSRSRSRGRSPRNSRSPAATSKSKRRLLKIYGFFKHTLHCMLMLPPCHFAIQTTENLHCAYYRNTIVIACCYLNDVISSV